MTQIPDTMSAVYLPGNSTAQIKEVAVPEPGPGQVLLKTKASTICGSDIRAIYREHKGKGPEAYQNVIAGHEPCGQIVKCGEGLKRFNTGDPVIVYHISGCGVCNDCRRGYMVSCSSEHREAYGWQRDGGMAEYILADEKDLVYLPPRLSYTDGAQVACGFGTVYEAIRKTGIDGDDAVLVVGLGPVGLANLMVAKAMGANKLIGVDIKQERIDLAREKALVDEAYIADEQAVKKIADATYSDEGVEKAFDCSGSSGGRQLAIRATRPRGSVAFIGEGGDVTFNPSPDLIHKQISIHGSWVTSTWMMQELTERLVRWDIHPETLVTHRFPINEADQAYELMASGKSGKVAVVFDEEIA